MCFIKKGAKLSVAQQTAQDKVERHEADAETTKNSLNENEPKGFLQNVKTSPIGLTDSANIDKKTLLGE